MVQTLIVALLVVVCSLRAAWILAPASARRAAARRLLALALPTALSLLAWYVFAPQCMSTLSVVRRETNSMRYPLLMAGYMFALAYTASFLTYRISLFFIGG